MSSKQSQTVSNSCFGSCVYVPTMHGVHDLPLTPQAKPAEMAKMLPGKKMHVRALCNGLAGVRTSLVYVKKVLEERDTPWLSVQNKVAQELTLASMSLGGILDACIIAELPDHQENWEANGVSKYSFTRTSFKNKDLCNAQREVNELRSEFVKGQAVAASLWSLVNFWKHYLPYQPLPSEFTCGSISSIRDFLLELGQDQRSGPVVHDLLIPAFNAACCITSTLLDLYTVPDAKEYQVEPIHT